MAEETSGMSIKERMEMLKKCNKGTIQLPGKPPPIGKKPPPIGKKPPPISRKPTNEGSNSGNNPELAAPSQDELSSPTNTELPSPVTKEPSFPSSRASKTNRKFSTPAQSSAFPGNSAKNSTLEKARKRPSSETVPKKTHFRSTVIEIESYENDDHNSDSTTDSFCDPDSSSNVSTQDLNESEQNNYRFDQNRNFTKNDHSKPLINVDDAQSDELEFEGHDCYSPYNGSYLKKQSTGPNIEVKKIRKLREDQSFEKATKRTNESSGKVKNNRKSSNFKKDKDAPSGKESREEEDDHEQEEECASGCYLRIDILLTDEIREMVDQSKLHYQTDSFTAGQYRKLVKLIPELDESKQYQKSRRKSTEQNGYQSDDFQEKECHSKKMEKIKRVAHVGTKRPPKISRKASSDDSHLSENGADRNSLEFKNKLSQILNNNNRLPNRFGPIKDAEISHDEDSDEDAENEQRNPESSDDEEYEEPREAEGEAFIVTTSTEPITDAIPVFDKFNAYNSLPTSKEEFEQVFAQNDVSLSFSNKIYHSVSAFYISLRKFYEEFQFAYYKDYMVRNENQNEDCDLHLQSKKKQHKQALNDIIEIYSDLLDTIVSIEYTKSYGRQFAKCLNQFAEDHSELIVKYLRKYSKNVNTIECGKYSDLIVNNLAQMKSLCEKLKEKYRNARNVCGALGYIFEEFQSTQNEENISKHLMVLKITFKDRLLKMKMDAKSKNRVIAEMQVMLLRDYSRTSNTKTSKAGPSHSAISTQFAQPLCPEAIKMNLFLLEDRIILANYIRHDKQCFHSNFYLTKVRVEPVCIDGKKRLTPTNQNHIKPDSIRDMASKERLRFVFEQDSPDNDRAYEGIIVKIKETSLKELRDEVFVQKTLINDATRFMKLFEEAKIDYGLEHPEEDQFSRQNSIWSVGSRSSRH